MDKIKNEGIQKTALKLADEIKNLAVYKSFYSDVQHLVSSPNIKKEDFKHTLQKAMKEKGLDTRLRNTVFHWVRSLNKQVDPLALLTKASAQWEKRIHKSLNSMSSDLDTSLAKLRLQSEQDELMQKWNELSTYTLDLSKYRPVYAPKDFLEVLLTLSGYIPITKEGEPKWEFAHLPLKVKTLDQLRQLYVEWSTGEPLLGVNPLLPISPNVSLESERVTLGERVATLSYAPVGQEFLKKGSPQCLRSQLWANVLGVNLKAAAIHFYELKKKVLEIDLMIDKLIFKDVQLTASNDDQYFVFEDLLYQVMLCFSRDSDVLQQLNAHVGSPFSVPIKGKHASPESFTIFPPSGVIPFHGFTMYATPFCYLYDDPAQLYGVFKAFYVRYWFRLHHVSTHPQGIVNLCLLFERLLEAHEPLLWVHFRNINVNPIRVVFKWIMRAFSGHLPPDQLLLLWDSILGYDSLEILPLLALSILSFRKENLFQVNTAQHVDAVLADLSTISVISLLQLALMSNL